MVMFDLLAASEHLRIGRLSSPAGPRKVQVHCTQGRRLLRPSEAALLCEPGEEVYHMWPTISAKSWEIVGRWEHHEIERFAQLHTNRVDLYKSFDFVVSSSAHEFPRFHTDGRPHLVDHVAGFRRRPYPTARRRPCDG